MSLPYNKKNKPFARFMRNHIHATRQENHLWYDFLSKYPVKFRRQAPIDNFIADFYCHKAKLVIELDGSQHETEQGMHNDALRTEKLEAYGLQVIRIPNRCIDKDFYRVCDYIDQTVKNILGDA
jgi:very-short-patch-repair endonuclease